MSKILALLPLNVWLIVICLVLAAAGGLFAVQRSDDAIFSHRLEHFDSGQFARAPQLAATLKDRES